MKTYLPRLIPVLPSANIARDVAWYHEKVGFKIVFSNEMYAVMCRDNLCLNLQWHADTPDDPLLGGSVVRWQVNDVKPLFEEFVQRGTVQINAFKSNTAWGTNEFGFHDLNNNAIFILQDLSEKKVTAQS